MNQKYEIASMKLQSYINFSLVCQMGHIWNCDWNRLKLKFVIVLKATSGNSRQSDGIYISLMNIFSYGYINIPDSKVHGANMGPTWVLFAPDGPHVGPINFVIKVHGANMGSTWVLSAPDGPHVSPINFVIKVHLADMESTWVLLA